MIKARGFSLGKTDFNYERTQNAMKIKISHDHSPTERSICEK